MTAQYGLIGYPLGHSFSSDYFNGKFERERIDARYELYPLQHIDELPALLTAHPALKGLNVTIPYKEAVLAYLDWLSPEAEAMGAVNVIRVEREGESRRLCGYNSDYVGFRDSLEPLLPILQERYAAAQWIVPGSYPGFGSNSFHPLKALVLGTGGASKAVAFALQQLDIPLQFVSRRAGQGLLAYTELDEAIMAEHSIIVNTTPLGMSPKTEACPDIPYQYLQPYHLLYDVVYNPQETLFMKMGKTRGAFVKNGLEMLHRQAEEAWRIWQQ